MMAATKTQHTAMTLKELLTGVCATKYIPDIDVYGLALDSRKVESGYVFIALEGQFDHGLVYAEAAVSRGAVAVICDAESDQYCQQIMSRIMARVICVPVSNLQEKLNQITNKFYDSPAKKMFISGVTGTDGKTSVSHFISQAMNQQDTPAAVIGTLGNGLIDSLQESTHTTPDVVSLYEMMAGFYQQGAKSIAMEVSSHGLDQNRVAGVDFDVAVLTNVTRDHLDYHGDVDSYRQAKRKLFTESNSEALVLNADDEYAQDIFTELKNIKTIWLYGLNESQVTASNRYVFASQIVNQSQGMTFLLTSSQGVAEVSVRLIGEFNIYNVLACFCVLLQSGLNFNYAVSRLEKLHTVPGRMEMISQAGKPCVVIDYAHTPEALSQALKNVRRHTQGKIICVFGCGGNRDTGKRPLMARVAETLADLVIVTNDNPRNEDPLKIIDDIKQGISNDLLLIVEADRKKAIQQAVQIAGKNDLILIAGKGHEQYQIIGNERLPFSDKEIVLGLLGVSQ